MGKPTQGLKLFGEQPTSGRFTAFGYISTLVAREHT